MTLYSEKDRERISRCPPNNDRARSAWRQDYGRLIHSAVFRRLQGKTQLFPGHESDFFRNRLTHSIEVAQIAKGIASRLNTYERFFVENPLDLDLIETAALAHDLGHPPFGHNGERALDDCMKEAGGFEGNAQTLRILSRVEKKRTNDPEWVGVLGDGQDLRLGLDLTYRTLSAVLKYDREIPLRREKADGIVKGYYVSEADIVTAIKANVVSSDYRGDFRTIECSIMDIADDIAYSTYDLEDAFKGGFLTPIDMLALSSNTQLLDSVSRKIPSKLGVGEHFSRDDVLSCLYDTFIDTGLLEQDVDAPYEFYLISNRLCGNGYLWTAFTSSLVGEFLNGIEVDVNETIPALSKVRLLPDIFKMVEVLKHVTFEAVTMSPRLRTVEYRGYDIVRSIFEALDSDGGQHLLPDDFRLLHSRSVDPALKKRVLCDFVAGMTDRYAMEFYDRLKSDSQTIFKPF